jgi:hypothetical protein
VVVGAHVVAPRFASTPYDSTDCRSHFAIGAPVAHAFQRTPNGGCAEVALVDQIAYRVAAPISAFAGVERLIDPEPRRLQGTRLRSGALLAEPTGLFDTAFGERCFSQAESALDNAPVRCALPATYQTFALSADASCASNQPVVLVPLSSCTPPARYAHSDAGYHPILEPITPYGDDDCRPLGAPDGYEYRALGPAFPHTELALARHVFDP